MSNLRDVADVIRSKNSGPFELTFDIIFKNQENFEKFRDANILTKESFAKLYAIDVKDVLNVIYFAPAKAVKVTIIRPISSGALGETDVYGAQQHAPLLTLEFDL
ncbi:MAG: DUF4387 domain-containing protein [Clostridioides sp.]|jgi:hypothetical protein|nr:DUF4387 domain-containing protein [Clostridioides sp.]